MTSPVHSFIMCMNTRVRGLQATQRHWSRAQGKALQRRCCDAVAALARALSAHAYAPCVFSTYSSLILLPPWAVVSLGAVVMCCSCPDVYCLMYRQSCAPSGTCPRSRPCLLRLPALLSVYLWLLRPQSASVLAPALLPEPAPACPLMLFTFPPQ